MRKGLQQLKDEVKDLELESRQVSLCSSQTNDVYVRLADNTSHPWYRLVVVVSSSLLVHGIMLVKRVENVYHFRVGARRLLAVAN